MVFNSKRNIIIISGIALFLIVIGVWFFFFRGSLVEDVPVKQAVEQDIKQESPDDTRIRHMKLIKKYLDIALSQQKKIPLPANAVEIHFDSIPLVYQGETSDFFFDTI